MFLRLAAAAEQQAATWLATSADSADRVFVPTLRAHIVAGLIRRFGPRSLKPVLAAMKLRGLSVYGAPVPHGTAGQAVPTPTPPDGAGHVMPTSLSEVGARHRSSLGGNLRATVFGMNDGLLSNASLVLGVAGAGAGNSYVLMTGAAGLLAGALSMAAGEYVSVRTQREMYEYQIALEREEVAKYPEEEAEELALIYEARGVNIEQAREVSRSLLSRPQQALDVLAREELGLNPDDLGSPWRAAISSFVAFGFGALVPLVPFLVRLPASYVLTATITLTALALFFGGMVVSLFTGRDAFRGAVRMVLIGGAAGTVTFLVGKLLGAAVGSH